MRLPNGYHQLAPGTLATMVTFLEMRAPVAPRAERSPVPWTLRQVVAPALDWYRALFRRVGEPWLWSSRLLLSDADLQAILAHPDVEVHALEVEGRAEGILELDFRQAGACEITYFGLAPSLTGQGAGRWLMNRAVARAWSRPITRLWLHTCDMDAPTALPFYLRSGFAPYDRQVDVFDDPRLIGLLPRSAAPQVLLIDPA